jgi:hypothetical protein
MGNDKLAWTLTLRGKAIELPPEMFSPVIGRHGNETEVMAWFISATKQRRELDVHYSAGSLTDVVSAASAADFSRCRLISQMSRRS